MKVYIIIIFLLIYSCVQSQETTKWSESADSLSTSQKDSYELVFIFNGILIEKFDSLNNQKDRYNKNNKIFTEESIFYYSFQYIKNDELFAFKGIDNNWDLIPKDKFDNQTITTFQLQIPKSYQDNYPQTIVKYYYPQYKAFSSTGVIENEGNIWLHPPRDGLFRILQLNPFPYIKQPLIIGNKWEWKMEIGAQWSDKRWKTWSNTITNYYEYEIVDKMQIKTPLGNIECFKIFSEATSELGKTYLISYFNPEYGFVKLDYVNIDGSKITISLNEKK
jgi:hypothetical protein